MKFCFVGRVATVKEGKHKLDLIGALLPICTENDDVYECTLQPKVRAV